MPGRGSRGHLSGNLVKQSRVMLHSRGRPLSWGAGDHLTLKGLGEGDINKSAVMQMSPANI